MSGFLPPGSSGPGMPPNFMSGGQPATNMDAFRQAATIPVGGPPALPGGLQQNMAPTGAGAPAALPGGLPAGGMGAQPGGFHPAVLAILQALMAAQHPGGAQIPGIPAGPAMAPPAASFQPSIPAPQAMPTAAAAAAAPAIAPVAPMPSPVQPAIDAPLQSVGGTG